MGPQHSGWHSGRWGAGAYGSVATLSRAAAAAGSLLRSRLPRALAGHAFPPGRRKGLSLLPLLAMNLILPSEDPQSGLTLPRTASQAECPSFLKLSPRPAGLPGTFA